MSAALVIQHYEEAEEWVRQAGRDWYPTALLACQEIATDQVPVERVARAMAALSPRCFWSTCVNWTRQMVAAYLAGQPMPEGIGTGSNRRKAWAELHGERALSGPKTTAFAAAILGDPDTVVIDSWILRTVGLKPESKLTRFRQRWISAAYAEAAEQVGETPRDLQAIVWCAVRGRIA